MKKFKITRGHYIVEMPLNGDFGICRTISVRDGENGLEHISSPDVHRLIYLLGGLDEVLKKYGCSLECASHIVNNFRDPSVLRIMDTETWEIVNPMTQEELMRGQPAVVQTDLLGNDFLWNE